MNAILSVTLSYLLLYKYAALFAITFLASILLPLPSDTTILATGAFAGQGYLNIYLVIFLAFAGSILGDIAGFIISRRYGKEFLKKIGLRKMIESRKFTSLEKFIDKNSGPTIFITRFIGQLGPLVNILSGLSDDISYKKFLFYATIGEFMNVIILSIAGYFLGNEWQNFTFVIEFVGIGIIVLILAFIFSRMYFRRLK
jgi:membrane protein DedA with SNARE-associated domain